MSMRLGGGYGELFQWSSLRRPARRRASGSAQPAARWGSAEPHRSITTDVDRDAEAREGLAARRSGVPVSVRLTPGQEPAVVGSSLGSSWPALSLTRSSRGIASTGGGPTRRALDALARIHDRSAS